MRFIKTVFMLAVVAAAWGGVWYFYNKGPCDSPITYRIGDFDPKFGVSKADFEADAAQAVSIWDDAFGRQFFKYDPNGTMPINLVYDTRQATVDTNKTLAANVDKTVASADTVKSQFLALKTEYEQAKSEYDALSSQFEAALKSYNDETAYWNSRGGAPMNEYNKLQEERASLETLRTEANDKMLSVNDLARQVNAFVDTYNTLVNSANSDVSKINQSANREFEEGEYISDAGGQRINVYEFDGKTKLVRLLAHEFGHALGLDHNANPQSIMYYLNKGTSLTLTGDDVSALKTACRIK
ncbi:MAG TPA: matrixin family metalloprotease [Candidatus Paceibacterota bacterium]|nr:matrixin family metalloprotease [Candidatus Paceibacterota bacterium]